MKNKNKREENFEEMLKKSKGITLIALVVTIVVLIILATISINAVMGDDGLIKRAEQASQHQANAEASESDAIDELLYQAGVATGEIITNPYNSDGWTYAWVCTNGTWGEKLEAGETITEGEGIVVAKLYETGNKITPADLFSYTFVEGNEYVMVIEGQGEMGPLIGMDDDIIGYAWEVEVVSLLLQQSNTLTTIPYITETIICEGVTNIGEGAFYFATELTKTRISKSVTNIEGGAFFYCRNLNSITIPENVNNIGDSAFESCESLTNIVIPNSVKDIGEWGFNNCENLKSIIIPNGITSIEAYTFSGCTNLVNITITNSVKNIEESAFINCDNLKTVTYLGTQTEWNAITIGNSNEALTNATINYLGE